MTQGKSDRLSRRQFVKASAAVAAATTAFPYVVRGATDDKPIRFGVIGCGGRGRGACRNAMEASSNVKLVAAADIAEDRLVELRDKMKDLVEVDPKHCFHGFDAYKKVLEMDLDYVILATPPYYRPEHFEACIEAGKHVFTEKPVAVDPVGARRMMAAGRKAAEKGLKVVAGTQRRHQAEYIATIKRIHDGEIGKITAAQCYWDSGQLWYKLREAGWTEDEWMHRDWVNWCWLSGDHIVEQHVHNIDVINWVIGTHPEKVVTMGARQRRVTGDQFDMFSADFTYPGEVHVHSECRQINGCTNNVSERVAGEKGWSNCRDMICKGGNVEKIEAKGLNPYVQEHADLIEAIRTGKPLNEAQNVAESTLTNIMSRMSAYSGKEVTWDEVMKSDLVLKRPDYELTPENIKAHIPVPGTEKRK